jgi:chromosome partitioning protein
MRVLSLVNQKGGCGKTTAAIHLAGALAAKGRRVLVVDLDPQAHATMGLGSDPDASPSLHDVLMSGAAPAAVIVEAPGGLSLLPASPRLAEFEEASERTIRPESALRTVLREVAADYDVALLDCPARADSVMTANALFASSLVLLVVETGAFALQGALRALRLFSEMGERQGSSFDLRVLGTMFDRRTRFARELLVALHARFGDEMFDTVIRTSVRLREAAAVGVPVQVLDPRCRAVDDFASLADEVAAVALRFGRELSPGGRLQPVPAPAQPAPLSHPDPAAGPLAGPIPGRSEWTP